MMIYDDILLYEENSCTTFVNVNSYIIYIYIYILIALYKGSTVLITIL